MSVLIKGIEMPEKCGSCDLFHAESPMHCTVVKGHKTVGAPYGVPRPDWCPLVALPDTHGRLVDVDALIIDLMNRGLESVQTDDWAEIQQTVMEQPTIVEAEDE